MPGCHRHERARAAGGLRGRCVASSPSTGSETGAYSTGESIPFSLVAAIEEASFGRLAITAVITMDRTGIALLNKAAA